jgi:VanZ family protein
MIQFFIKKSVWFASVWTLIILILCSTPGRFIPSSNWLDLLSFDKFVHASIFFTLCCLWFLFLIHKQKVKTGYIVIVLLCCESYGGLLEIMQSTIFSERAGDWLDFIANSFGCLMALVFFLKKKNVLLNQIKN